MGELAIDSVETSADLHLLQENCERTYALLCVTLANDTDMCTVSSNVSVDVDSAQRSIHVVAETWKTPTQAWINTTIPAQAWKKAF